MLFSFLFPEPLVLILLTLLQGAFFLWVLTKATSRPRFKVTLYTLIAIILNNAVVNYLVTAEMGPTDDMGAGFAIFIISVITTATTSILFSLLFLLFKNNISILKNSWYFPFIILGGFLCTLPASLIAIAITSGLLSIPLEFLIDLF